MDHPGVQETFPVAHDSGQRSSRTLHGSERPHAQSMVMINSDQNAAVTNSTITMAGNNVNNYSVNITLNGKPSYPTRREPRSRQKPYSRPEPSSSRIPPAQPSTRTTVNKIAKGKERANESSHSRTASSSNVPSASNMEVVSLDHLDIDSHLAKTAGPVRMPHEIYTRQLYSSGHGYPCANPKPWGEAIKIGDVGVLSDGGLDVLENIYTLPQSFLCGEAVPVVSVASAGNILTEGDTVTGGIDDCTVKMSEKCRFVEEITMQCHQQEGAALVVTSPAELHRMSNNNPLRQYLHTNGPRLFEFLQKKHNVPGGSSLYIVTGTVLSASWAIATHGRSMKAPYNTLTLKRYVGDEDREPFWAWTQRASAKVLIGETKANIRDQCLFLRGFLITRRSRGSWMHFARHSSWRSVGDSRKSYPLPIDLPTVIPWGRRASKTPIHRPVKPMQRATAIAPSDVNACQPTAAPEGRLRLPGSVNQYPPSHINDLLIKTTGVDFAISHDDDWRIIRVSTDLDNSSSPDTSTRDAMHQETVIRNATTTNRVAHLTFSFVPTFAHTPK